MISDVPKSEDMQQEAIEIGRIPAVSSPSHLPSRVKGSQRPSIATDAMTNFLIEKVRSESG